MYLHAFFMGLLFFVAGFFAPGSLDRKGTKQFIRDRAFRLGLPVLFYMFVLGPICNGPRGNSRRQNFYNGPALVRQPPALIEQERRHDPCQPV